MDCFEFTDCEFPVSLTISAPAIPTIGQASLIASVAIVTIRCPCKTIIMGQMGLPLVCQSCKRTWFVSASMKITVSEVLTDLTNEHSFA